MSDEAFKQRAARRQGWPIRRYKLGEEPSDGLAADASPSDRLAMMWQLALDAWASTGRALPTYERSATPGQVIRRGPREPART